MNGRNVNTETYRAGFLLGKDTQSPLHVLYLCTEMQILPNDLENAPEILNKYYK